MNADARYTLESSSDEFTVPIPREGKDYVAVVRLNFSSGATITVKFREGDPDGGFSDVSSGSVVDTSDGSTGNPSADGVYAMHLGSNDFFKVTPSSYTAGTVDAAISLIPQV